MPIAVMVVTVVPGMMVVAVTVMPAIVVITAMIIAVPPATRLGLT